MKVVKPSRINYYKNFLCSLQCKSEFYTGRITSNEVRTKLRNASKLMWEKEGFREKYDYQRGEKNHWFGKKMPETARKIMSEKAKIRMNTEERKALQREIRAKQVLPFRDSKPEKMVEVMLNLHNIKYEKQKIIKLPKYFHPADFFIEPNICLEVDGCWYHFCLECYGNRTPNKMQIDKMKRDVFLNTELNKLGYQIIRIWDHDILKNNIECAKNIIKLIQQLQHKEYNKMIK